MLRRSTYPSARQKGGRSGGWVGVLASWFLGAGSFVRHWQPSRVMNDPATVSLRLRRTVHERYVCSKSSYDATLTFLALGGR